MESMSVFCTGPDYLAAKDEPDAWSIFLAHHDESRENWATTDMVRIADDVAMLVHIAGEHHVSVHSRSTSRRNATSLVWVVTRSAR